MSVQEKNKVISGNANRYSSVGDMELDCLGGYVSFDDYIKVVVAFERMLEDYKKMQKELTRDLVETTGELWKYRRLYSELKDIASKILLLQGNINT